VASEAFGHIEYLVGGRSEDLQKLVAYTVPDFSLPELGSYNRGLRDYLRDRQSLILRERAEYLKAADWLKGLKSADRKFTQSALDPATYEDGTNAGGVNNE